MLPERRTGTAHGYVKFAANMLDAGTAGGLEGSLGSLLQDQLIQRQVGDRLAQPRILSLQIPLRILSHWLPGAPTNASRDLPPRRRIEHMACQRCSTSVVNISPPI